ncbi:hypothetical protein RvY_16293 [Ramazzottius varieornatus]|uniref:Metalloendopeptidase n=1 Tax=Ramazzottius varieornatus TaxID=947166 RepID=A0A1D1VZ89_RAMVA|nr:hypothetical protein RvY_16293 [Ramazzottius varieornatus]
MSGLKVVTLFVGTVLLIFPCGRAMPIGTDDVEEPDLLQGSEYNSRGDLVEGDMLLDDQDLSRNGLLNARYLWRYRRVYYTIAANFSAEDRALIRESLREYDRKTCLQLIELPQVMTSRPPWMEDYIVVYSEDDGCYSSVGRRGGAQRLNLQSPGCMRRGTIIHEFMHAIGFYHEQSRTDRDDYVEINWANIPDDKRHNFDTYPWSRITVLGEPYDYESVMHYSSTAFTNVSGVQTIIPKQPGVIMGQRVDFSLSDIKKINRRYACS